MKQTVLFYRPICNHRSPTNLYKATQNLPNDAKPVNISKPSNEQFNEIVFDFDLPNYDLGPVNSDHVRELIEIFNKQGDNPSYENLQKVYDLVRNNTSFNGVKKSIYSEEIESLYVFMHHNSTFYEKDENKYVAWCFEVDNLQSMYLVHIFSEDLGCGCFSSSIPLAVFSNESDAENFLKKCTNVYHSMNIQNYADNDYLNKWSAHMAKIDLDE